MATIWLERAILGTGKETRAQSDEQEWIKGEGYQERGEQIPLLRHHASWSRGAITKLLWKGLGLAICITVAIAVQPGPQDSAGDLGCFGRAYGQHDQRSEVRAIRTTEASQFAEEGNAKSRASGRSPAKEKAAGGCFPGTIEEAIEAGARQVPEGEDGIGGPDQECQGLPEEARSGREDGRDRAGAGHHGRGSGRHAWYSDRFKHGKRGATKGEKRKRRSRGYCEPDATAPYNDYEPWGSYVGHGTIYARSVDGACTTDFAQTILPTAAKHSRPLQEAKTDSSTRRWKTPAASRNWGCAGRHLGMSCAIDGFERVPTTLENSFIYPQQYRWVISSGSPECSFGAGSIWNGQYGNQEEFRKSEIGEAFCLSPKQEDQKIDECKGQFWPKRVRKAEGCTSIVAEYRCMGYRRVVSGCGGHNVSRHPRQLCYGNFAQFEDNLTTLAWLLHLFIEFQVGLSYFALVCRGLVYAFGRLTFLWGDTASCQLSAYDLGWQCGRVFLWATGILVKILSSSESVKKTTRLTIGHHHAFRRTRDFEPRRGSRVAIIMVVLIGNQNLLAAAQHATLGGSTTVFGVHSSHTTRKNDVVYETCHNDSCPGAMAHLPHVYDLWCEGGSRDTGPECYADEWISYTRLWDERRTETEVRDEEQTDTQVEIDRGQLEIESTIAFQNEEDLLMLLAASTDSDDNSLALVMYGLYQTSVGNRRTTTRGDLEALKANILRTWQDYLVLDTMAHIHPTRPQTEARSELHLLIEFTSPRMPRPNADVATLRHISWEGVWQDPEPSAIYLTPGMDIHRLLIQIGLREWCGPELRTQCNVHIEKNVLLHGTRADLQDGTLVEAFVHLQEIEDDDTSMLQLVGRNGPQSPHVYDRCCGTVVGFRYNGVPFDTPGPGCLIWRPNANLLERFDDTVPDIRNTPAGQRLFGWFIPPPNWEATPMFQAAVTSGAVQRGADGILVVRIRSWFIAHGRPSYHAYRDFSMRPQLLVRLQLALRRIWSDRLLGRETIQAHAVRPAPAGDDRTRRFHVLAEIARPIRSNLHPMLIAVREISRHGVARPTWCATLFLPRLTTLEVFRKCNPGCEFHQFLLPSGHETRRWMTPYDERVSISGLFIPAWFDRRLERLQPELQQDGDDEGEDLVLMQRTASASSRPFETPSSVGSSASSNNFLAHVYHMSAEHRLLVLDRATHLTYLQQIEENWQVPQHVHFLDYHIVKYPPRELEETSDLVAILELSVDRNRWADDTDKLLLLDVVLLTTIYTGDPSQTRRVVWSRRTMTRQAILHLASSAAICDQIEFDCIVHINHDLWSTDDAARRLILHG